MLVQGNIISGQVLHGSINGGAMGQQPYAGPYEIEAEFEDQALPTKGKTMKRDVTVHAIRVSRTSNQAGGKTIYIGGLIDV